jgi:hypothetical protein
MTQSRELFGARLADRDTTLELIVALSSDKSAGR